MFVDVREDGEPGRPRETHLRNLYRLRREALQEGHTWAAMKFPSNIAEGGWRLARELALLAPRCTVALRTTEVHRFASGKYRGPR